MIDKFAELTLRMYDSDSNSKSESGFRINEEYAAKYDKWRQKEELQKLKDKYGDITDNESSSESEDEVAEALTDKLEKQWLQTLSALKHKDPKIYDSSTKFYDESSESEGEKKKTKSHGKKSSKKEKPYVLKDYERDLIVKKGGKISESEGESEDENCEENLPKSYQEEQDEIKKSFKYAVGDISDSDSGEEFLTKRKVSQDEKEKEDEEFSKMAERTQARQEKSSGN